MLNKKSQTSFFFVFLIFSAIIILASAAIILAGVEMADESFTISEILLNDSLAIANEFTDADMKSSVVSDITAARDNIDVNITVYGFMFKYGWV